MKRIVTVAVLLFVGFGAWTMRNSLASQSKPPSTQEIRPIEKFEINPWGTLKSVRARDGREIFGKNKSANEGYAITYQLLDPKDKRPILEPRSVYAIGNTYSRNQLECEVCKAAKAGAVMKALTSDKVLRIDSSFSLDEKTGVLNVVRLIENVSKNPVQIISVRVLHDMELILAQPTRFSPVDIRKTEVLKNVSYALPRRSTGLFSSFLPVDGDPFDPPCRTCPPHCVNSLSVNPGDVYVYCVKCMNGELEYDLFKGVGGNVPGCKQGESSVMVEGWDRLSPLSNASRWDIVCITCSKAGGMEDPVIVPAPGGGAIAAAKVESLQKEGKCQLGVKVDRGTKNHQFLAVVNPGQVIANSQSLALK